MSFRLASERIFRSKFSISRIFINSSLFYYAFYSTSIIDIWSMMTGKKNGKEIKKLSTSKIFPITPISNLKARPFPQTAACLIIGDEILNGKTVDINSGFFAKFCFNLGIDVKRIEIIPDEEEEIIEAVKRLSSKFDFVVTSGGIGPTHDDITYPSIARAYNLPLKYHQPTLDRIESSEFIKKYYKKNEVIIPEATKEAHKRMALFPHPSLAVFPSETTWVPIVIVNENIHILPGIPKLFRGLLSEYGKYLQSGNNFREGEGIISERGNGNKFFRRFVKTFHPESYISSVLAETQKEVKDLGIKIGSYPKWTENEKYVMVSFLSREVNSKLVEKIAKAVAEKIDGVLIESNKVIDDDNNNDDDDVSNNNVFKSRKYKNYNKL
ncbi:hypothetical protein Glove_115g29 [Diversispora epigaea]|uniref:MoaB/Mog domain-containing protein n=1 Tax=Diversispora epigaea TaxID=1348612 RepID=A0A397J4R2_9GLOM|nr:hypothetical protein Glove_115g29 [Diversispora epigaea]